MKRPPNIDAEALSKIKELGINTEKEQEMEFFFYFPREHNAYAAASALANLRFKTSVTIAESGKWVCMAMKTMRPTDDRLDDLRGWMEKLAEQNNGDYDGWGYGIFIGSETQN